MNRLLIPLSFIVASTLSSHVAASNVWVIDMSRLHEEGPELNYCCKPSYSQPKNPATLEAIEEDKCGTLERYSDGLVARIEANGNRIETWKSGNLSASMPHSSIAAVDCFIKASLNRARLRGLDSSHLQSRLLQFSRYYLKMNEPSKCLPLATEYLKIQKDVGAQGFPLALAESISGQNQVKLQHNSDAIPLLQDAAAYFRTNDQLEYATIENNLGDPFLNSGEPAIALHHFEISQKVSKRHGFRELNLLARQNCRIAHAAMVASKK